MSESLFPLLFICPTYNRSAALRDFVAAFGNNIIKHGHKEVPMLIVDDSVGSEAEANIASFKEAAPAELLKHYVGAAEKEQVLSLLESKAKLRRRDLQRIFKSPCYGANRNWTLLYSFGEKYISSDDDMWPYANYLKNRPSEALEKPGWSGAFVRRATQDSDAEEIEFDQVGSYLEFLGKQVSDFPELPQGDVLFDVEEDTAASLHAAILGNVQVSGASIVPITLDPTAKLKFVNPQITGDGDIDSEDIIVNFLEEGTDDLLRGKEEFKYVLERVTACLTKQSWRISPAVLGVDNREGVIPYAPTSYRFEDFVFRIYAAEHPKVVTACPAMAQHHERSLDARETIVSDFFNEETAKIMKRFLMNNVESCTDLQLKFPKEIEVTVEDVQQIVDRGRRYYERAAEKISQGENFSRFAREMEVRLDSFRDIRRLQQQLQRAVQCEIDDINYSNEVWPQIFEVVMSERNAGNYLPFREF